MATRFTRAVLVLTVSISLLTSTRSQITFAERMILPPTPMQGWRFGSALTAADVDHDGFDDLIAWESGAAVVGVLQVGRAWILRGPLLVPELAITPVGGQLGENLGWSSTSVGDVNGDGALDIVAGAPFFDAHGIASTGRARLFLGPGYRRWIDVPNPSLGTGDQMGDSAMLLTDTDGDGLDDLVVGARRADTFASHAHVEDAGRAWVWKGSREATLGPPVEIPLPQVAADAFFGSLAYAVDWDGDGDGGNDLVLPAGFSGANGFSKMWVFDGSTLSVIDTLTKPIGPFGTKGPDQYGGKADIDGDGLDEVIVGSQLSNAAGCTQAGALMVLSASGEHALESILYSPIACMDEHQFGFGSLPQVSDLDRDGDLDVTTMEFGLFDVPNRLWAVLGPRYDTTIAVDPATSPTMDVAWGATRCEADFDGDGFPEIAVYVQGPTSKGRIDVYDLRTLESDATALSASAGGSVSFHLRGGHDRAGLPYLGVLGATGTLPGTFLTKGAWVPLNVDAITDVGVGLLGTSVLQGFLGHLDEQGFADLSLVLPPNTPGEIAGHELVVAAVVFDTQGRFVMASSAATIDLEL